MKYNNHEQISPGNTAPTPEQLRKLTLIGALSAARRSRLRRLRESDAKKQERLAGGGTNPPVFYSAKVGSISTNFGDGETLRQMSGRFGARIDENDEKVWSLKLADIQHVHDDLGNTSGERTIYLFEWTRARTKLARRTLQTFSNDATHRRIDGVDKMDQLMNEIDNFYVDDDIAQQWLLELEMEEVTGADCDGIIDNFQEYFERVDKDFLDKSMDGKRPQDLERGKADRMVTKAIAQDHDSWQRSDEDNVDRDMWEGDEPPEYLD